MESQELDNDLARLVAAVSTLSEDVRSASGLSSIKDTQFVRRTYVRAVFALVEGNINLMADIILRAHERNEIKLTVEEISPLREESYELSEQGKTIAKPRFFKLQSRLRFVLELFPRLYDRTHSVDTSVQGWNKFKEAIKLRNRITHPRDKSSFYVTDEELDTLELAREWFNDSMEKLLDKC